MKKETPCKIEFHTSSTPIEETPRGAAIFIKQMIENLGLAKISKDLGMEKHHGICIEDIILVLLLFSSYGVKSISQLEDKARHDKALAAVIDDVKKINTKILLYFQGRSKPIDFEKLLSELLKSMQKDKKFKSLKDGVIAIDDTNLVKSGKHMENIDIIFDHNTKHYVLGYVLVVLSYADSKKAYPISFEFRLKTDREKQDAQLNSQKKQEKIDLRKKGSLLKLVELQEHNDFLVEPIEVTGVNLDSQTLEALDNKKIGWIGIPNNKTVIFDNNGNQWNYNTLIHTTKRNKPIEIQIEGWMLYSKKVVLSDYGKCVFTIVTDRQSNELGRFLFKDHCMALKVTLLQEYFSRHEIADSNKLKIALNGVQRAKDIGIRAETIVADAWFLVAWFINAVIQIKGISRFVTRLKSNSELFYKGEWITVNQLWDILKPRLVKGKFQKTISIILPLKGFSNPVNVVFLKELDKNFQVKARYALLCTDVTWSWIKIVEAYKLRWTIECFFRTAKQSFGLQSFHNTKFNKIVCHVTFSFIAYLFSAKLKIGNPALNKLTFGLIVRLYFNCLIILKKDKNKLHVYFDKNFVNMFGLSFNSS
jgi:hypothetical protein